MVGGDLGDDFIFVGEFGLVLGESFLQLLVRRAIHSPFKRGSAMLEEFLLPAVEHCRVQAILVTKVGHRLVFE